MAGHRMERWIGMNVTLVYMDRRSRISQRTVRVDAVENGKLKGYCLLRRGPRVFDLEGILAFRPERSRVPG